jgi:hypothetical protein
MEGTKDLGTPTKKAFLAFDCIKQQMQVLSSVDESGAQQFIVGCAAAEPSLTIFKIRRLVRCVLDTGARRP